MHMWCNAWRFKTLFWQNPSQKFSKNFIDFEKSQNFPKTAKVRLKIWNGWWREGLRTLPVKKSKIKVEEHLGMKFRVSERCLGGEKTQISWERSKRIDLKSQGAFV